MSTSIPLRNGTSEVCGRDPAQSCAEAAERTESAAERLSSGVYAPCRRFDEPRIATNRSPGRTSFATKLWGLCRDMPQSSRAFYTALMVVSHWDGVGAVGKWPAAATATSLAAAGHLSTAVVIADLR